jgi:hypothetical protein
MGEAMYYMKAEVATPENVKKIKSFFREVERSQDYWQKFRDMEDAGERELFWQGFKSKFPKTYDYLTVAGLADKDCNNELAGQIDFGSGDEIDSMELRGETIYYRAYVWHFSQWDNLMRYLVFKFQLMNPRWLSDEYINPFDLLDD